MYECLFCGAVINELPEQGIRCPSCAGRIFFKLRQPIAKKIKAR